ncbi:MAG: DUF6049 family protein [Actinomycetes bacterium]
MIRRRALGALLVAIGILTGSLAGTAPAGAAGPGVSIALRSQPAWASAGDDVRLGLTVRGDVRGLEVRAVIHTYLTTRAGFDRAVTGSRLGGIVGTAAAPADALPFGTLTIPLQDPDAERDTTRIRVPFPRGGRAGVFPVQVEVRNPSTGERAASFVTFLTIVAPLDGGDPVLEPLRVAWVWPIVAPPATPGAGPRAAAFARSISPTGRLGRIAAGLGRAGSTPLTLQADPATLQSWSTAPGEAVRTGFSQVRAAAADPQYETLGATYTPISIPAFVANELPDLAVNELDAGLVALRSATDRAVSPAVTTARPLDAAALALLTQHGTQRVVVRARDLASTGTPNLTPARPFTLSAGGVSVPAVQTDDGLAELFARPGTSALQAARLLNGLALIALELPSQRRGVVVQSEWRWSPSTAALGDVAEGLDGHPLLTPRTVSGLFGEVPVERTGSRPTVRRLASIRSTALPVDPAVLRATRERVDAFAAFAGNGPTTRRAQEHVLVAPSSTWGARAGAAQLDAADATMDEFIAKVRAPVSRTLTLTSRTGVVPLSFQNDTGQALQVRLRLRSDRLTFPDGKEQILDLPPNNTTVKVRVNTTSPGSFPLLLSVTSVDGRIVIERTRITVRSSVVSGIGIALTVTAGVFLLVWWVTHWRRTRRRRVEVDA